MNSSSSRIVHNRLASEFLYRLLDWRKWDELKLAEVSGIVPSVISAHLSGQRPIRPQYLGAYLRVLDGPERSALLGAWLQDNVRSEVIASLLEGTETDSMRSVEEVRCRMLDWWATAIARDFKLAKIFRPFSVKAALKLPLQLLSLVSTTSVQFQGWLLEKACILFARVRHATVALVTLLLALCQPDKGTEQAGGLTEQGSELAGKAIVNSLFTMSFVAPPLAETTNFDFDWREPSPSVEGKKARSVSRANAKGGPRRSRPKSRVAAAKRIQRTIGHEWNRLVRARRSVHTAFGRLIREAAAPRQSSQTQRKQRSS